MSKKNEKNKRKRRIVRPCLQRPRGRKKSKKIPPRRLLRRKTILHQKVISKEHSLKYPSYLLLSKETSLSTAIPLKLEVIPKVKELLDEGFVRKSLNSCAFLVPKIGIMRHQIPMIGGLMNVLSGVTLFCKITHASNIFMIYIHMNSLGRFVLIFSVNKNLGGLMGHLRFVVLFGRNNQHENTEKCMFYCINFLNFLNKDQMVLMDPKRIKVIPEWPIAPSIRKIWSFHDLTKFYKRFIPYFSILVAPLVGSSGLEIIKKGGGLN